LNEVTNAEKARDKRKTQALADLFLLRDRLSEEGESELLEKIAICQEPIKLRCNICKDIVEVKQRCKRKWCPCCQIQLAAQRSEELEFIVARFRHPLAVHLTMRNVNDLSFGGVRKLRRSFGKLRHRKLWTRYVRAGVAAIEVTNIGNGWHPHIHCAVDCVWLAAKCDPPPRWFTKEEKAARYKEASQELERVWSKILGQETSSLQVKRIDHAGISKEVLKYSIKSSDIINCEGSAGDLIRAMDGTRLMTTFGKAHGQCVKEIRADAKRLAKEKRKADLAESEPRCGCGCEEFVPAFMEHGRQGELLNAKEIALIHPRIREEFLQSAR
jgi:hypothetical protein